MSREYIPLWLVTIMNVNVMLGGGVFVNAAFLTEIAGPFGALSYLVVALIMLPLALVISELSKIYPAEEGSLYTYSKYGINTTVGIINIVSYFVAKSVSCAVLARIFVLYLQSIFPALSAYNSNIFISAILITIGLLNLVGMRFGSRLQLVFVIAKMVPLLTVILLLGFAFNITSFTQGPVFPLIKVASALPIALYAMIGFETCCAIGHMLEGGSSQIYKAVLGSFCIVAIICTLFQLSLFSCLGQSLAYSATPLGAFFTKVSYKFPIFAFAGEAFLNSFVMTSIIGSCYGIIQTNTWNAHVVAKEYSTNPISSLFTRVNKFDIPVWCVIVQVVFALIFALSSIKTVSIQRMVVLGIVLSYFLTVLALMFSYKKKKDITLPKSIALMSFFSCLYITYNCVRDLF